MRASPVPDEVHGGTAEPPGRVRSLLGDSMVRNSAFLLGATVVLAGGGFVFWQFAAHLSSPAEVGRAGALISASTLIATFALLGMNNSVIRFLHRSDAAATVNTGTTVVAAAATVGSVLFLVGVRWFAPALDLLRHPVAMLLFALFTVTLAVSLVNDSVFIGLQRSGYILTRNTAVVALRLLLLTALVGLGATGIFTAYSAAVALGLLLYLVVLERRFGLPSRPRIDRVRLGEMWRYSAGNYLATAILMTPTLIMPVLIAQRVDAEHAAYFYIASLLASVLVFVPQAAARSFFADAAAQHGAGLRASLARVIRIVAIAEVPALLALIALGHVGLGLFGPSYTAAYPVLVLLGVTSALTSVGYVGSTVLMIAGRLRLLCGLSAVAGTTSVAGAYLFVGHGLVWAGWSLLTGELILAGSYVVVIRSVLRRSAALDTEPGTAPTPSRRSPARRLAAAGASRGAELWRRYVERRATNVTGTLPRRGLLVVAPHPDDETFGAGATIARCRAAGIPVTVVVATDGARSTRSGKLLPRELATIRRAEVVTACRHLGVGAADVLHLDLPDGELAGHAAELTAVLCRIVAERRPERILIPAAQDLLADHVAAHRVALRVALDAGLGRCVLAYPVWAWTEGPWFLGAPRGDRAATTWWAFGLLFSARRPVSVSTAGHLAAKRRAIAAHTSQTTNLTGEPDWSWLRPAWCGLFLRDVEVFLPADPRLAADPTTGGTA
jgi:LmbE family N-acetylglucosaminyl deacetylase/O-antigen/teichoic acid export membrane protein